MQLQPQVTGDNGSLNTEKMTKANWHIRNIDEEYQRLVRAHAAYRNVNVTEMLEIIIGEWTNQNQLTLVETNKPTPPKS